MDAKKMGEFIAQRRKECGMTQSDLADRLHVTDKAVSRWERGLGFPDINTIEPLANALGVTILELMKAERKEPAGYSEKDAAELMRSAAELAEKNRKQELAATVLAAFTTAVVGLLTWAAGFGNLLGSLFFGALVAVAEIGLYYYINNREDASGRKIYALLGCAAAVIVCFLFLCFML